MAQIMQIGKMWYSDLRMDGKRVRRALSVYKPRAKKMLLDMMDVRRAHKHGDIPRDMSWTHFRDLYLKESMLDKNDRTYRHDRQSFEMVESVSHLTKLQQMTPDCLLNVRIELLKSKKYGPVSMVRGIRAMMTAMRWAEDRKYIGMQNWRVVQKKNREPKGRLDFYEPQAYMQLLSKLEGDWFTSALIMGRTGLRLGEMLHLEWTDIQFEHRRIVFRSKPHLGWKIKKDDDLTKVRIIPLLTPDLRQHLESLRRPSGFVLSAEVSRHLNYYGWKLGEALKATGVRTYLGELGHPHLLRHTFASHLAQVGISLKKIQEWMGHSDPAMTDTYSHLCPPDATSETEIEKKLCSSFVPSLNSLRSLAHIENH